MDVLPVPVRRQRRCFPHPNPEVDAQSSCGFLRGALPGSGWNPATRAAALIAISAAVFLGAALDVRAALLAYEPFTNSPGADLVGSGDGSGFSGVWQANGSSGVATNTGYGLAYTDSAGNTLAASGGAGFFQGSTSTTTAMQPFRLFSFSRGTNGVDGGTTWISFLAARQGPTGTLSGNPYGRGANIAHDLASGTQKLAVGNSSGATSNTVGLIPQGSGASLVGSTIPFGGTTNFIVVRIDHRANANDIAWLFVNPVLTNEPSVSAAGAVSSNAFDFSFERVRIFAGGQSGAQQPYAELVVDEYRVGETFADVAPVAGVSNPPVIVGPLTITNVQLLTAAIVLSGLGGSNNGSYYVLSGTDPMGSMTNWDVVATNSFDAAGRFLATTPAPPGAPQQFYRLFTGALPSPPAIPPSITTQPTNQTVLAGRTVSFIAAADGTTPLRWQWRRDPNTPIAGATNSTLVLTNVQNADAGVYFAVVTNSGGGATSTVATLTVLSPPSFTTQPVSQTVTLGSNATFTAAASGTAPLVYQWYLNTNTLLAGKIGTSLTLTNVQITNAGTYSVVATNNYGAATSSVAVLTVAPPLPASAYYVSPTGSDSNPGTVDRPFLTISKGLTTAGSGGLVYVRGGTYAMSSKLSLTKTATSANPTRLWAYPAETPLIDSTGNTSDGISISGVGYHLKGLVIMNAGHNGINISGHSNTVEFCTVHDNGNTGLHITGGSSGTTYPSYNLILNCDSYHNYDPPIGGNADGFSAKWNLGPGNVFRGCRCWENSDDGWDLWMGDSPVLIEDCWAFRQGTNYWASSQFNGNGNGFKLGGNYVGAPHRLVRCIAFQNHANGVDQNNNIAGQTVDQTTSWANGSRNFNLSHGTNTTPHIVRNNLSFAGTSNDSFTSGTLATNNSWQVISPAPNATDVLSVDASVVTGPRQSDGNLPVWPFLRPVPGGRLVDKGVDIGEPYNGAAPDLGAFESGP